MDAPCAEVLPFVPSMARWNISGRRNPSRRAHRPPPWTLPISMSPKTLVAKESRLEGKVKNHEVSQPPLYYTLAGLLVASGKMARLRRWTPAVLAALPEHPVVIALVWLGHLAARLIFREHFSAAGRSRVGRLHAADRVLFDPNDVLSPVCFGAAFIFLAKFLRQKLRASAWESSPA